MVHYWAISCQCLFEVLISRLVLLSINIKGPKSTKVSRNFFKATSSSASSYLSCIAIECCLKQVVSLTCSFNSLTLLLLHPQPPNHPSIEEYNRYSIGSCVWLWPCPAAQSARNGIGGCAVHRVCRALTLFIGFVPDCMRLPLCDADDVMGRRVFLFLSFP